VYVNSRDFCWHVYVPTSPNPRTSASGSRLTGKDIRPRRRSSMSLTVFTLRLTARRSHCSLASISLQPSILIKRQQTEFGVSGTALSWIQSYLQNRTQCVKLGQHRSSETTLEIGVPQGSVLSPLLFAQSPTSSRPTASDAINTPMTLSST